MTICIAAICEANYDSKIVICTDWQYSSPLGSAETGHKQRYIRRGWMSLFAGEASAAKTLLLSVEKHFETAHEIDETNVLATVRSALNERKRDLADEYSQGTFAISYEDLLKFGKEKLPEHRYRAAVDYIANTELGAELLIVGFLDQRMPVIIETDQNCGACMKEQFACIGEGRYLAHSVMLHRAHEEASHLGTTLYRVFEAKKYAERIRSVGRETSLVVFSEPVDRPMPQLVMPAGMKLLERWYTEYGPKESKANSNLMMNF